MPDRLDELEAAEKAARTNLQPLRTLLRPSFEAADVLLRAYAGRFEIHDVPLPVGRVQRTLLTRFADDLRAAYLLGERGYAFQAMTMAATALETGFAVAHIRFSERLAQRWLDWKDPHKAPWKVNDLISGALEGDTSELTKGFRYWYTFFCWGKHANPLIQAPMEGVLTPESFVIETDPEVTPVTTGRLYWCLNGALQLVPLVTKPLFENDPGDVTVPWRALERLANEIQKLHVLKEPRTE